MKITGLISVIVPIYKTEKYLKKCIDSIINQSYKNLEIILVNDGSPDNALLIMSEYAKSDSRIKIINKENGGLSSARNAGLLVATGEYVTFVDSDDYLELNIYENIIKIFDSNDIDIVAMRMQVVDEKYRIKANDEVDLKLVGAFSGDWYFKQMCERKMSESVGSKVFKSSVVEGLLFNEKRLNEDFLFLSELFLNRETKIFITNDIGYNYYTRNNSITQSGFGKSLKDAVYNTRYIYQKCGSNQDNKCAVGALAAYQARTCIITMTQKQFKEEKEFVQLCRRTIQEYRKCIKKSFIPFKDRLLCTFILLSPRLSKWAIDLIRRRGK